MIDMTQPFNIARFPTIEEARIFARQQAPLIDLFRIEDATRLHPEIKDPMPISVLYQLRTKCDLTAPYALDRYGNMLPNSLWPTMLRSRNIWF